MYVVVPPSIKGNWAHGLIQPSIVESIDLYVTLADLAGLALPGQALGGETMRPLLQKSVDTISKPGREKTWALTQWPRRPSCTWNHGCEDGHGNPYEATPDQAIMGYKLRTERWAYIVWVEFDWGEGSDPNGKASRPLFDKISAQELYDHAGDTGDLHSGETYEWHNLAYNATFATTVQSLHNQLVKIVDSAVVKPMTPPSYPLDVLDPEQ